MDNVIAAVSCHLDASCEREAIVACAPGVQGIEWFDYAAELLADGALRGELARLVRAQGLRCSYHAPWTGGWDLGLKDRRNAAETIETFLRCAASLGADLMTMHLGSCASDDARRSALETVAGALEDCLETVHRLGVSISVENVPDCWGTQVLGSTTEDFDVLFARVASERVGLNLDVGHANITGNMAELLDRHGRRLLNTHLHDNDGADDQHNPPGQGTVDWADLLGRLAELGYPGPLTFEFPQSSGVYGQFIEQIRD